jgi:hypothetical protein
MFDINFWKSAGERAVKTFAQTLVALVGVEMVGIHAVDWPEMISVGAMAALLSVLTSVASANFGKNPGPSLTDESTHPDTIVMEVEVPVEVPAKKAAAKKSPAKKATPKKK